MSEASFEYPAGAIENGRAFIDRLESHYEFREEMEHRLVNCSEWIELKRCFEYMATSLAEAHNAIASREE